MIELNLCGQAAGGHIGRVALPGHALYDAGCRVLNGAVRRRPAIVAFCEQAEDVPVAVQPGHYVTAGAAVLARRS